ncbi:TetR/AcrR family transcriptional regulator [Nocardioides speluncae]|uniref:TetR/AcrR family transcriptional regulator n=1 Tax=Nocardioides speluncae TaxID=2670337 RepID=UPI000D68B99D|nr:TetR/AcrR family transcriptional regulator [Nocardioides speluncae]
MPKSPKTPLSRDRVLEVAVAIADADGLAALSMRTVARRLGVEAMSLYHHVKNKDDLLDSMVDVVFGEMHLPEVGGDWADQMRERSRSGRAVLKRHRWAVGLMDSRRNPGPANLRHHDAVLGCLREAGFSVSLTGNAFALLDAHLYGFLVQELALPFEGEADLADLGEDLFGDLPEGELRYLQEFAVERALQPGYDFGEEFDIGLDLILDGLAHRLAGDAAPR